MNFMHRQNWKVRDDVGDIWEYNISGARGEIIFPCAPSDIPQVSFRTSF